MWQEGGELELLIPLEREVQSTRPHVQGYAPHMCVRCARGACGARAWCSHAHHPLSTERPREGPRSLSSISRIYIYSLYIYTGIYTGMRMCACVLSVVDVHTHSTFL